MASIEPISKWGTWIASSILSPTEAIKMNGGRAYFKAHEESGVRSSDVAAQTNDALPIKRAAMVAMRDDVELYTELYLPAGASGPVPAILIRTPYPDPISPFADKPIALFCAAGYGVVIQSCRGTWKSGGQFRFFQNEATDGYDAIEWIAAQAWSNGKICMYGSSYSGSVQWLAARLQPPHLVCIAPQSPGAMFFYEPPYIGGVYAKAHQLTWPRLVSRRSRADLGFEPGASIIESGSDLHRALQTSPNLAAHQMWQSAHPELAEAMCEPLLHPRLDDWWERIMLTAAIAQKLDLPIFAITGFHDGDQAGCLYNWSLVEAHATGAEHRRLMIGPWRHSQMATGKSAQMGLVKFGADADVDLPREILQFFNHCTRNEGRSVSEGTARCRLYVSGSNRWHDSPSYPPPGVVQTRVFLTSDGTANSVHGHGALSYEPPGSEAADRLTADWERPVPHAPLGEDARPAEGADDVLIYTGAPLTTGLTIIGPIEAVIHFSADALDCDLVVRIEDVWPDGSSVNMTGEFGFGAFRARYRDGFEREVLLTPGLATTAKFHVCHMGHTFMAGHRLRIAISATVADILEPNHHTGQPIATAVDRRKAVQTIYHDAARPSHVIFPQYIPDV